MSMTENEIKNTKEWFEDFIETYALSNQETIEFQKAVACLEELQQYRAIGTIDEFKALKEKNEPKKMLHNGANWYRCSNGCEIHKKQFEKDWYCPKCGQKLDWSE